MGDVAFVEQQRRQPLLGQAAGDGAADQPAADDDGIMRRGSGDGGVLLHPRRVARWTSRHKFIMIPVSFLRVAKP